MSDEGKGELMLMTERRRGSGESESRLHYPMGQSEILTYSHWGSKRGNTVIIFVQKLYWKKYMETQSFQIIQ